MHHSSFDALLFRRSLAGVGAARRWRFGQVRAWPPFAFTLRYLCQDAKVHRVCLKLRLRSQTGFSGTANVGLKCTYQVTIGGTVVAKEVVGYGRCPPEPYDRHITRTFFTGEPRTEP